MQASSCEFTESNADPKVNLGGVCMNSHAK